MASMIKKVFFDITKVCNANCIYCFTNSGDFSYKNKELSNEMIYELVESLIKIGIEELSIGGGEPFIRDVCSLIKYIDGRLKVSITTNGTIINSNIIDVLEKYSVNITISMDAINQSISNLVRPGIDVKMLIDNIKILLSNNVIRNNMSLRTTVSKYNLYNLIEILEFCDYHGVKKLKINSVNNFGRAKKVDIAPEFCIFMEKLDEIIEYCQNEKNTVKVVLPVERYLKENDRECTLGNQSIYIDSFGNVYPCAFSEGKLCWGNVSLRPIKEIIIDNWKHNNEICINCPINRYKEYKTKTLC